MSNKRILIAAFPEAAPRLQKHLGDHFDLVIATRFSEACDYLRGDIDLVLCSLSFDDEKMFALLQYMKAEPRTQSVPFLCIQSLDTSLPPTLIQSIETALKALGAQGYAEIFTWRTNMGDDIAYDRLRQCVLQLMHPLQ